MTPDEERSRSLLERPWSWELLAAAAAAALYLRTVGYGWVFDDQMAVVLNRFIRSWAHLPGIFATTAWAGSGMETYLYRPLPQVTFLANHAVSGLDPWSYHFVNVLLHAGVSVLVIRVGMLWGLPVVAAGLGGVLFAAHPVHVEVVAAVHGRKDLLAALFVLWFVLLHFRARREGGAWTALAVLSLAAAALSKETGFTALPLLALVVAARHRDPLAPIRDRRATGLWAAYLTTTAALLLLRFRITGGLGVPDTAFWDNPLVAADVPIRVGTALAVLGGGLGKLVFPRVLSPDYSFAAIPLVREITDPRLLITLVALALVGWLAWRNRRRHPWLLLACLWYLAALLPASNLLVVVGTLFGDRLLYLPSVAFCLALGWLLGARTGGFQRGGGWALGAAGAIVLAFGAQTLRYSAAWTDDITLFRWAVQSVPASTKAHHKLGEEYLRVGRLAEAVEALNRAVIIAPHNAFAQATRNQALEAIAGTYQPVVAEPATATLPQDPRLLYALGQVVRQRGDTEGARRVLRAALGADPSMGLAAEELAVLLLEAGDTTAARHRLELAVRADTSLVTPWFTLGRIHLARGRHEAGLDALERFSRKAGIRYPDQVAWAREVLARSGR